MTLLLRDDEIRDRLDAATTVAAMRAALHAAWSGRLVAPPRASAALAGGRVVLTAGQLTDDWYGFRSYDTFGHPDGEQVVVLHDAVTGAVRAVAVGAEIGSRRTGGLGAVAVDVLARPDASTVGLVGAGGQAWAQLWAIAEVRRVREVTVFSPTRDRREAFAARARGELGLTVRAVGSAAEAVRARDVVVLATTSVTPVVSAADLAPGTHVNVVGFKQRNRSEFGPDLLDAADVLVTDSQQQAFAYDPPLLAVGPRYVERLVELGAVLAGAAVGRTSPAQRTVFCCVGLAGTEVLLLAELARSAVPGR